MKARLRPKISILGNVLERRIGRDISTVTLENHLIKNYLSPPQTLICPPLEVTAKLALAEEM